MKKKLLLFSLLISMLSLHAQNVDSLWSIFRNTKNPDSIRFEAFNDIAWGCLFTNPDSAYLLGHQELEMAREKKLPVWEAKALNTIGASYQLKGNYAKAIDFYQQSLKIREKLKDTKGISASVANIGSIYINIGEFEKALTYQLRSLKIFELMNNKQGMASAYNNIGLIHNNLGHYDQSIEYTSKGLKLFEELGDKQGVAASMSNLGNTHYSTGDYLIALEYQMQSLKYAVESGDKQVESITMSIIARTYLKQKKYNQAIEFATKAKQLAIAAEDISAEKEATATLYDIYKATNNHNKALENYERFIVLKDSLFKEDNQREIAQKELEYEYEKKAAADSVRNEEEKRVKDALIFAKNAQIEQDKTQKWALAGGVILLIIFGFFMYNRFKITQKQKNIIEEKQKEISASINYAKRIQYALLAHEELLKTNLPDHFVLFKPKDIVSGDFYWATQKEDRFYLAVCDSTGHGVPGAFMSLLNISFLNEAINEKNMEEPNRILEHVRKRLIKNISQEGAQDGMDGILICFDRKNNSISYAAAHNKPILIKGTELIELPADKMPIGKGEKNEPFRLHTISAQKGDMLYLFTDGYADQFGGEHGKKFKYKQLEELFRTISSDSLNKQREELETTFINWQGNLEQIDDVCIIGIRF